MGEYILYLNLVLLSRLPFISCPRDGRLRRTVLAGMIQFLALFVFETGAGLALLIATVALVTAAGALAIWRKRNAETVWGAQFILICILCSYGFSGDAQLAIWFRDTAHWILDDSLLFPVTHPERWQTLNLLVFGSLLLTNEPNLWMRAAFRSLKLVPQASSAGSPPETDEDELNAGRLIGILERNLMYIMIVLANSYTAVGFIIAAKGFARFRQMEERPFAEYVLIGTLASTLITLVVASGIQWLMANSGW